MEELTPSNAVLAEKIDSLKGIVSDVHVQVLKTNGRVTALEKTKNMLMGGIVLANVVAIPVILAYIMKTFKLFG